jgi:hypothetical protein
MLGKIAYIKPKVVRPISGPCTSESYVHRAVLLLLNMSASNSKAMHLFSVIYSP